MQITKQALREYLTDYYFPFREKAIITSMMIFPFFTRSAFKILGN